MSGLNSTGLFLDRAQVSGHFLGQGFYEEAKLVLSTGNSMGRGVWRTQWPRWDREKDVVLPGRLTEPREEQGKS